MAEWYFLTNHSLVLSLISKHQAITGLELSRAVGITERAVRKVIADLYEAGYIEKEKEGRCIKYRTNHEMPLRHELHREVGIGELLEALKSKGEESLAPDSEAAGSQS